MVARAVPGISLGFVELAFVMVVICFFIAIPSVPGYWGVWEAGGMFAMLVFDIPRSDAAGYQLINHAVQIFPIMVVGLFSVLVIMFGVKSAVPDIVTRPYLMRQEYPSEEQGDRPRNEPTPADSEVN